MPHPTAQTIRRIGRSAGLTGLLLTGVMLPACAPSPAWIGPTPSFQLSSVSLGDAAPAVPTAPDAPAAPPATESTRQPNTELAPPKGSQGGSGTGGGTGGGTVAPGQLGGLVVDAQDQPIAGASVMLANGTTARTDARGRFAFAPPAVSGPGHVFAEGYATSMVLGAEWPEKLHLQRLASADPAFESSEYFIRGKVTWPAATPQGGTVHYRDGLDSASAPVVVDTDGSFVVQVTTRRAGRPRGVLMALAAGADRVPMVGVSPAFSLLDQGGAPLAVPAVRADRVVDYEVAAPPDGLSDLRHRLEIAVPGATPFVFETGGATTGQFRVPAEGALPAQVRIAIEASGDGGARSVVALDPYALPATPPSFLAVPALTVQAPDRKVAWEAPGASAVLLELFQAPHPAEAYYEAWLEGANEAAIESTFWPTAPASARVVAVDGPEASARHVASVASVASVSGARALRLLPFSQWRGGFRLAETRVDFTP